MTRAILLDRLKEFTEQAISGLLLPTKKERGENKIECRPADVYKMRLPDSNAAKKKAPYIIHQVITGKDRQKSGSLCESETTIRSIFCVYGEDEQEGALLLLNLMERLRIELLKKIIIAGQFQLLLDDSGIETLIYPDDNTAPFFAGEMVSRWRLPAVEREVSYE
jgi:hypothetical protein